MKITKTQLKQIIKEELESPDDIIASHPDPEGKNPDQVIYRWQQDEFDHREKVLKSIQALDYLKMKAQDYHNDPTLGSGDIKALLQDDFMDSHYTKYFGINDGEPSVAEFIEQYAAGEGLNEGKKMKLTKAKLKQIIKEELEVTLTNEEAGEMFGEEVESLLEQGFAQGTPPEGEIYKKQVIVMEEDPSYAEALQVVGQAFAQMASTFGPAMIAGLFLKVAKDALTKARSEDPVATQTDTDIAIDDLTQNF